MPDIIPAKKPNLSMDELDLRIIEQLKSDVRRPILALAQSLGVNKETVRYRLNRLIDKGALTIICASNIERLGYQFMLMIGVKARSDRIDSAANQLAGLPSVMSVSMAASHYNIMGWAFVRDQLHLTRFVLEDLAGVFDATSIEIMYTFHNFKLLWRPLNLEQGSDNFPQNKLSDFDLAVISAMQQKPKQSITELAKTLGCSRRVASNTLEKLIKNGTIGFWPVVNPVVMGYSHWVQLLIKSKPNRVMDMANALSIDDTIMTVSLITGYWHVGAVAMFKDSRHMHNFTSDLLSRIPGILEIESIPLGKILKFSYKLVDWI